MSEETGALFLLAMEMIFLGSAARAANIEVNVEEILNAGINHGPDIESFIMSAMPNSLGFTGSMGVVLMQMPSSGRGDRD